MPITASFAVELQYGEEMPGYFACVNETGLLGGLIVANPVSNTLQSELGVDIDCITDITPNLTLASGWRNLANALVRRLLTVAGFVHDITGDTEAADYGYSIRERINSTYSPGDIARDETAIQAQMLADERVLSADVVGTFELATSSLTLTIDLDTREGPFTLIMNVSALTVEILDGKGTVLAVTTESQIASAAAAALQDALG